MALLRLHGMNVATDLDTFAASALANDSLHLTVRSTRVDDDDEMLRRERTALPVVAEEPRMRILGRQDRVLVDWPGLLSAVISDNTEIEFRVPPTVKEGFESLCLSAAVGALAMVQRGLVLHGSCVEFGGHAFVLLARSGGGKSSVGALMCSAGAALVSEDICKFTYGSDGIRVESGVHEIRLRDTTPWLTQLPNVVLVRPHIDGRAVIRPNVSVNTTALIRRIAVVNLDRSAHHVSVESLSPHIAIPMLLGAQRCPPISGSDLAPVMFESVIELFSAVGCVVVTVPWSEDKRNPGLGAALLEALS
jgi:hypothetical protein